MVMLFDVQDVICNSCFIKYVSEKILIIQPKFIGLNVTLFFLVDLWSFLVFSLVLFFVCKL